MPRVKIKNFGWAANRNQPLWMSQLKNKNVHNLKNIVHIAVHFPMGTSKVCNKISIMYKIKYLLKREPKIPVDI